MTAEVADRRGRLSDDEAAYHVFLVEQVKEAQDAQGKIARIQSSWGNWAEYLKGKYDLSDGDVITEEGAIVYGETSPRRVDQASRAVGAR
jgi:hypothetical protein